jgi:hypothetical protein
MELRTALEAVIADHDAPPFSYDRPGGIQDEGAPWHAAAMAVLGAPRVTISPTAQSMAGFMGLAPIVTMWRAARKARLSSSSSSSSSSSGSQPSQPNASQPGASSQRVSLEPVALDRIRQSLRSLDTQQWKVEAILDDGEGWAPLLAVKEIRRAVLREYSQSDGFREMICTREATSCLLEEGAVASDGCTLHLQGVRTDNMLRALGLAPRHPSALHDEPGRGYKFGDLTRGLMHKVDGLIDGVQKGVVERTLIVNFECVSGRTPEGGAAPEPEPSEYLPRVHALLKQLRVHGQIRELHGDDGEYTSARCSERTDAPCLRRAHWP